MVRKNEILDHPSRCVIVFLKCPDKGNVKTRLASSIGDDRAVAIYRAFVEDTLEMVNAMHVPVNIYFYPDRCRQDLEYWLGNYYSYILQTGGNIGERMANAFSEIFSNGYQCAALIGTDTPDLPAAFLTEAFDHLEHDDAVVGPAMDGGYYLIAFRSDSFDSEFFDGIPWSTHQVLEKTIAKFKKKRIRYYQLPRWRDIDHVEDLSELTKTLSQRKELAIYTYSILRDMDFFSI